MVTSSITLSRASSDSVRYIQNVYAHHVLHGTGSFEEVPPTRKEIEQRWQRRESLNQPTLVAHVGDRFAGFAYAATFKERSAYRFTVEDSVYVAPEFMGKGVGRAMLEKLIILCAERNFEQMIAVIGDSGNKGSILLHERCGFRHIGIATGVGYKFGTRLDVVYMQRAL